MPPFPKIGLEGVFVDKNLTKGLDSAQKVTQKYIDKTKEATKVSAPLNQQLGKVGFSYNNLTQQISRFTHINSQAVDGILSITRAIGPMAIAAGAAGLAIVGLGASFLALGNRGAALIPLAESFDNLTASVGISSQTLLVELRKAANGTVSDFDLIKRANLALVGSAGEFGKAFGEKLPQVLAAARAAAKATGQDVDFLFQSLVSGIKRASPRLIDNTGIVLKISEANQTLADQLGKTVEQLTLEEQQIAVLNATVAAGAELIGNLGDQQESNSEKLARSSATITNILDSLAIAVQPVFGVILDGVNSFLSGIQGLVPYIAILLNGIGTIIGGVVQAIGSLNLGDLAKQLFEGAARAFGAFANGIITAANTLIFPAVIGIATFIADFLIGFSPPKKGPLSKIDKGGENLMLAWLQGITGVSLDSVANVAKEVSLLLGDIGKATLPQVDARLAQLDAALLPFQNRLDIVKSQFEAIAAPANAALEAIDRQILQAQEALAAGDASAAETIRRLDATRAAIQGQLDVQQAVVDKQQIQLGLASASQAQERALLNIRKAQLEILKGTGTAAEKVAKLAKLPKEPGGAGAPVPTEPGAPVGGGFVSPDGSVIDLLGGQGAIDEAIAGIQDAFASQLDTSQLATFQENQGLLGEQFARIGSVDLGSKLKDKFKGLTDLFDPNIENSPANVISRFFSGDPSTPGSIASFVDSLNIDLSGAQQKAADALAGLKDLFDPNVEDSPADVISRFFSSDPSTPGSFASFTEDLKNIDLHSVGESVGTAVKDALSFLTGEGEGTLRGILDVLFADAETEGSIANFFGKLPTQITDALSTLYDDVVGAFDGVFTFLTGTEGFTLSSIIDSAVQFFEDLPGKIIDALRTLGQSVWGALGVPVIGAVNSLIEMVETAIKGFIGGIGDFVQGIVDGLGDFAPQFLRDAAANLKNTASGVNFGRISTELPAFLQTPVPAAARGGMFTKGLLTVGERGPELIGSASKIGVLPAQLSRLLTGLEGMMAAPAPMTIPGGNTYNNASSTYNFNGVQSDNDARRRYNTLRAGMR